MPAKTAELTLLHLSDLHIRADEEETTDRGMVLDPLLERLEADYNKGLRPELVLITGDIAFQGIEAEYELALPFLQNLLQILHLSPERLYMVPGNHDVYRKAYRPTETTTYSTNREINEELGNADYRADLLKGMQNYFEFVQAHFPHMTSDSGNLVPFVDRFKLKGKRHLGLVGLNSAWMCRKPKEGEDDSGRIAIGELQIKTAFDELRDKGETLATVVLFHHPLSWLSPIDRRVCEKYLDQTMALAGHLHEPEGGYSHFLNAQMALIQAGGAYLGSDSDWPNRYHYMGIDLHNQSLRFDFRSFSEARRQWCVDTETGNDKGAAVIPVPFLGVEETPLEPEEPETECPEFPGLYAGWLLENYEYLDAERLNNKGQAIRLNLPELYVPLYGVDPTASKAEEEKAAELMEARRKRGRLLGHEGGSPEAPDIETLPARTNALLIEGQAGSGKSTLMKHLAYTLSPETEREPASPEMTGYLPVLVLLKELGAYCLNDVDKQDRERPVGEEMLDWYLRNRLSSSLDINALLGFARCGRLLLLVDGLDEIDLWLRNHVVNALGDVLLHHAENKIVLSGRPHGLVGAPKDRFGKHQTSVKELGPGQVKLFVRQWFDYFYPGTTGVGKKNAKAMLGDINGHPAIEKLTVNPLMLTAMCLLYMDQKELPDQRAELLKKFIDNMIWRRFDGPETALDHLKNLAHEMHRKRVKEVDNGTATEFISKTVLQQPGEKNAAFKRRMEKLFEELEPQCGLLVSKEGQTGFWHLIFQEFLTAMYFRDNSMDYHQPIAELWDDEWYKEVIELYVSYLSLDQRKTANDIIHRVVQGDDKSPYRSWRLAARTFVDFHRNRRNQEVLKLARERLNLIIQKPLEPATLVDAGESLGWLGDDRDLESFAPVAGGKYDLENYEKAQTIKAFELARYPVTNQWFRRFVKAGGYTNEAWWTEWGKKWLRAKQPTQPRTWTERKYSWPNQPVTGVSWYEAKAFCNWLAEEDPAHRYFLPSAAQWQVAAAGKDGRKYPWGDASPTGRCNVEESGIGQPSPVGIFASGRTPGDEDAAIHDLAGNVWEWTSTSHKTGKTAGDFLFDEDFEKQRSASVPHIKGGSWSARPATLAARIATSTTRSDVSSMWVFVAPGLPGNPLSFYPFTLCGGRDLHTLARPNIKLRIHCREREGNDVFSPFTPFLHHLVRPGQKRARILAAHGLTSWIGRLWVRPFGVCHHPRGPLFGFAGAGRRCQSLRGKFTTFLVGGLFIASVIFSATMSAAAFKGSLAR